MNSVREASIASKKVILWSDLDVPIEEGEVVERARLVVSSKTIDFLLKQNCSILIIGHLGRPEGRDQAFSLKVVAENLGKILGKKIELLEDIRTPETKLAMLENIRFWPEEEEKNEAFAQRLANLAEIYVNDCFSTSHHAGSSMLFLPKFLPAYAGLALEKEVFELSKALTNPKRPLVAILAGAKLETKLPAINNMSKIADKVLVGGKLMFEFKEKIPNVTLAFDDVDGADIGEKSASTFAEEIKKAQTIIWNGTMGKYEDEKYLAGTKAVATAVVNSAAYSIVGGGDTVAALNKLGLLAKINHVSMGGGAMLDFLSGKKLEGLAALGYYDE